MNTAWQKDNTCVYGEAMAILAGDALLTYAFETAAKALDIEPQNPGIGKAIRILSGKSGNLWNGRRTDSGC